METTYFHRWNEKREGFDRRFLVSLLFFALLLRFPLLLYPEVIHNDGAEYIRHAKLILNGDWAGGKAPPFYPALIAVAHFVVPDWEMAGILVSTIFGFLLVLPVFYLGKEIFDERVGILSGLMVAVHPYLTSYSGSVLTDSTYSFLVAMVVLVGWVAFRRGQVREVILFSLLTSLAYLTRPEGIGFLMVFCPWILVVNPPDGKRGWTRKFGIVLLALFSFLILSGPYLAQIRKETGRWGITKKFAIVMESPSHVEGTPSIEGFTQRKEIDLLSLVKNPLIVLRKVGFGFFKSLYVFQQAYNPLLFFFAFLALFFIKGIPISLKKNLYLFAFFFFFLGLVLPFLWIARRYTSYMIPVAIPWAAFGFIHGTRWVSERLKKGVLKKRMTILFTLVLLLGLYVQGWPTQNCNFRMIQKEAGLWMRDHLPKGQKMMSKMGQESFYAEQAWVKMPEKNYEEILEEARTKGVRYLVVDEDIEKDSPGFLEKSKGRELKFLFELRKKDRHMIIFEIMDPEESGKE